MYAYSYINTAAVILDGYAGNEPFAGYLRQFFAQHKKYGSRDRKLIAHLCYCYFRLGKALEGLPVKERMTKALFLCSEESGPMLEQLDPALNKQAGKPLPKKMKILGDEYLWKQVFPLPQHIASSIDTAQFIPAHWIQPDLFLRIRPGKEKEVQTIVEQNNLDPLFPGQYTLRLPNSLDAAKFFKLNKQVVVQDLSSQQTGTLFQEFLHEKNVKEWNILDACAASGGKTMMLYDLLEGKGSYTVNDIRESILHNLIKRFKEAGIKNYHPVASDITAGEVFDKGSFDVIIADVPCSGSGTWSRNPEQLRFFTEEKLAGYTALQKNILRHLPGLLRAGGLLFYITCSVYDEENGQQAAFLQQECGLQLLHEEYFTGYLNKADTMYGAVLVYQ